MTPPDLYIVADGNAYGLDKHGNAFGAAVKGYDGSVEWENEYVLDHEYGLDKTESAYVKDMINLLHKLNEIETEYRA